MFKKLMSLGVAIGAAGLISCGGDGNTLTSPGSDVPGTVVVNMGSGIPPTFSTGVIAVAVPSLAAGGGTSLTVSLVTNDNALYLISTTIVFSSACIAQGLASAPSVTTTTGVATTTYSATGCSDVDVITASTTAEARSLSATGSVTVAPSVVGSIEFLSATPQKIGLQGTGGVGLPETATVVFRVVDSTGGPVAGKAVVFSLDTGVGGVSFTPANAVSGADGRVQTVVKSGSVATSVRVTATITALPGTNIATQSSQLVVTTGLPDQDSTSMALSCSNIEGFELDGTPVTVTMRLADRYNNPAPDGTAITFNTEGGSVLGSCLTTTSGAQSGFCAVTWTSSEPRPINGRSTILATAIGEETFVDINGSGVFDGVDTWSDLQEAFRDDNENGVFDSGEFFLDFNSDGVQSPPDTKFNGLLCAGPGSPLPAGCGADQKLTVRASKVIVMSGSNAKISDSLGGNNFPLPGTPSTLTGGGTVTLTIGDINNQPMPAGTTITAVATGIVLAEPTSYTVGCTSFNGPSIYSFRVPSGTTSPTSNPLTITVNTPSGVQTIYSITLN